MQLTLPDRDCVSKSVSITLPVIEVGTNVKILLFQREGVSDGMFTPGQGKYLSDLVSS